VQEPDLLAGWCLDIHRHIDTDILTDRQTERDANTGTETLRDRHTDTDTDRQTDIHRNRQRYIDTEIGSVVEKVGRGCGTVHVEKAGLRDH